MEGNTSLQGASVGVPFDGNSVSPALIAAAHELKSPLALVRQLSLAIAAGDTGDQAQALAHRITLTSERALRLTADLTRASRLQDSMFELEPVNPAALLDEIAFELLPLYSAKGRKLLVRTSRQSMLAVANRDLLRRVVINFADNALHYCTTAEPVELWVHKQAGGRAVRVGVRDYGPALPFNVWKTVQGSLGNRAQVLHARPESSGLGMFVAGQFAAAMGAKLGATRHRDGASFYIDLNASTQLRLL